ncbi:MAG: cupin domain-containing protein [Candidatus Magasanikbacteria bacterium]|nr:cupin domain-containing protein [Candidatus Magasanikbacteria bacterium]
MLVKKFADLTEIVAADSTVLRETLSGLNDQVKCRYSLAHAKLSPGKKSLKHALKTSEVYYIVRGYGKMHINDEVEVVGERDTVYIPPEAVQYIENIGDVDLEFICIVDPAWKLEDEILV